MKKFLFGLIGLAVSVTAMAALSTPDLALLSEFKNYATNGGAEQGKAGWTVSGTSAVIGDLALTTSTAGKYSGNASFTWTPHNADNYLTNASVSITSGGGLSSRECAAVVFTKTNSALHALEAYDGTNVLNSAVIPVSTYYVPTAINFPCPASGTVAIRINAGDTTAISFDELKFGDARGINLSQISQASFVGSAYIAGTASCTWTRTNVALGSFSSTAACPGPTVELNPGPGTIATTDTDLPKFTVSSLPPGYYQVTVTIEGDGGSDYTFAINDGTTTSGTTSGNGNTVQGTHTLVGNFSYATAGDRTFEIYGSSSSGAVTLRANITTQRMLFSIHRFPSSPELAYRPDLVNWRVDANITTAGSATNLSTGAVASYSGIESSTLSLTTNTNSLAVQIPCSGTNPSTGSTCAAGNESYGVVFNLPKPGSVRACVSFTHQFDLPAAGTQGSATFQVVETPNNAQTILQEGKSRTSHVGVSFTARSVQAEAIQQCGTFVFTSSGQKTLRLMYEQLVSGAALTQSIILDDVDPDQGQHDTHWEVYPIDQAAPLPIILTSEVLSANGIIPTVDSTYRDYGTLTITPGTWDVSAGLYYNGNTTEWVNCAVSNASASLGDSVVGVSQFIGAVSATAGVGQCVIIPYQLTLTTTTTYYFVGRSLNGTSSSASRYSIRARRIK